MVWGLVKKVVFWYSDWMAKNMVVGSLVSSFFIFGGGDLVC